MSLVYVESSAIKAVEYHAASRTLLVHFRDGPIYQYAEVPVTVYEGLLSAESKGEYFNRFTRGQFPHVPAATRGSNKNVPALS